MGTTTFPLFSKDYDGRIVNPDSAILGPLNNQRIMFNMSSETAKLQEEFFRTIQNFANINSTNFARESFEAIDLRRVSFGDELRECFAIGDDQKFLFMTDLFDGLARMGQSFMTRSPDIQDRGNSYILQIIGSVEIQVSGYHSSHDIAELYEKAQLVLLLAPPPSSTDELSGAVSLRELVGRQDSCRRNPHTGLLVSFPSSPPHKKTHTDEMPVRGGVLSPSQHDTPGTLVPFLGPGLARIQPPPPSRGNIQEGSTQAVPPGGTPEGTRFKMSYDASRAVLTFLPKLFSETGRLEKGVFSPKAFAQLREFWLFFDTDLDGTVSRGDIEAGLNLLAESFLATDAVSQSIANCHVQKRMKRVISSLHSTVQRERSAERERKSVTPESSSSSLHSSLHSSSLPTEVDRCESDPDSRHQGLSQSMFLPGALAVFLDDENVDRAVRIKSHLGDRMYRVHIGVGAAMVDIHEKRLRPLALSSLAPNALQSQSPSPTPLGVGASSPLLSHLALSPPPSLPWPVSPAPSTSSSSSTQPKIDQADKASVSCARRWRAQSPLRGRNLGPESTEHSLEGDHSNGGQSLGSSTAGQAALIKALKASLGPSCHLIPQLMPDPEFRQDYHLKFGSNRVFWFQQLDYGVRYALFLGLEYVSDPGSVLCCAAAMETFRCMFVHLGVGIGVHPFALQVKFRSAAERILSGGGDSMPAALFSEHLLSIVMSSSYCEMDVLNAVWPSELEGHRVMLVSFEEVGSRGFYGFKSIVTYTPETGPFDRYGRWLGTDVILTLKDGHFTLLLPKPDDPRNSTPWSAHPISDLVSSIQQYNAEHGATAICLQEYPIGPYLHTHSADTAPLGGQAGI